MKRIISLLLVMLFLVGCSSKNADYGKNTSDTTETILFTDTDTDTDTDTVSSNSDSASTAENLVIVTNNKTNYKIISFFSACSEVSDFIAALKNKTRASFSLSYDTSNIGGQQIVIGSFDDLAKYSGAPQKTLNGAALSVSGSTVYIAAIDTELLSMLLEKFISSIALTKKGEYGISSNLKITEDSYMIKELIPDNDFLDGMTVRSQKDHSNNDNWTNLGSFTYTSSNSSPKWILSQWDSGRCIWSNRVSGASNTLTDGVSKWVTYNPEEKSLLLRLNTDDYYKGNGAIEGDYWPHLLIEQNFPYASASASEKLFYSGSAEKLKLTFDLRMPYYSFTDNGGWVNAAQLYMYFGVRHKTTNEFIWFGVQLFDSRYKLNDDNYHLDGGKDDATGQWIYCVGMKNVYQDMDKSFWNSSAPQVTNEYIHFDVDLIPYLQAMVTRGISEGGFDAETTVDDFYIDYMNYGWEIIGTYDCGVEIKNLSLKSYVKN